MTKRAGLRRLATVAAMLFAGLIANADPVQAQTGKGEPVPPGVTVCPTPLAPRPAPAEPWSEQERWVWQQICLGQVADLGARFDPQLDPAESYDPQQSESWSERRVLSSAFLETILLHAPYRTALPRSGVAIVGALYRERVDLAWSHLTSPLLLQFSRFENGAGFNWVVAPSGVSLHASSFGGEDGSPALVLVESRLGFLSLYGSAVAGTLDMAELEVATDVDLSTAVLEGDVIMTGARIDGNLSADGVKVTGELAMESIVVKGDVFMNAPAELASADMLGGRIVGDLTMGGVVVRGLFSLEALTLGGTLFLDESANINGLVLKSASIAGDLAMTGLRSSGPLDLETVSVAGDLFFDDAEQDEDVRLLLAKVGRDLLLDGTTVTGILDMARMSTGGDVSFLAQSKLADANLTGAQVGGSALFREAAFSGSLRMAGATVAGDVELVGVPEVMAIDLTRAKVGGSFYLTGSKVAGAVQMTGMKVGASLSLKDAELADDLSLNFTQVGTNLILSGAKLNLADLTGVAVDGDLVLGHLGDPVAWTGDDPLLVLRNARTGALEDQRESWPASLALDLGGFSYTRLGGVSHSLAKDALATRSSDWFVTWLAMDKRYSPQPYEQLASVLRAMGHETKAKDVLYGGRKRARFEADDPWYSKLWQGLMLVLIGFGYRPYYAVGWIALFVVLGAAVIRRTQEGKRAGLHFGLAYSLDTLLPIIKLREAHYEIDFAGGWRPARYYFYFHQMMGYVLASFLVAGLSGLTK